MMQGSKNDSMDIKNLVLKAQNGDTEAMSILYTHSYCKVYYTVRFMIKEEDTLLDIMQDTYVKVFRHLYQYDGSDGFTPWVKLIAVYTAREWLKKKNPLLFSEIMNEEEGNVVPESQLVYDRAAYLPNLVIDPEETAYLIREILDTLPDDQRAVIGMFYYEELSVKGIAQLMGTTESAVKRRLLYGRKKIEKKVWELEKRGTKFYNLAPIPFLLLLFRSEKTHAAVLPNARIWNTILEKIDSKASREKLEGNPDTGKCGTRRAGGFLGDSFNKKIAIIIVVIFVLIGGIYEGYRYINELVTEIIDAQIYCFPSIEEMETTEQVEEVVPETEPTTIMETETGASIETEIQREDYQEAD